MTGHQFGWLSAGVLTVVLLALFFDNQGVHAYTENQAEHGAAIFAARCSTCHGDAGQGLAQWRLTWDQQHQNCSASKCHGRDHPPEGFYFPNNYAPALIGANTLERFRTARDVFDFVSARMPFQAPGSLSQDEYWSLTAFLLDRHGVNPDSTNLDATTAGSIALHRPASADPEQASVTNQLVLGALGLTALILSGVILHTRNRRA